MNGVNLADVLRRGFDKHDDDKPNLPLPEAQIATLLEVYARYAAGCPFKPGQIVTPRDGYNIHGAGVPHVVLEIGSPPGEPSYPADPSDTSSQSYGRRQDMRVALHNHRNGEIAAFWVESWAFEAWEGRAHG